MPKICVVLAVILLRGTGVLAVAEHPVPTPPSAEQSPAFEVASVKRNVSGSVVVNHSVQGDRYAGTNLSIMDLLSTIYELPRSRVVGGPDWIKTERYDIVAKAQGNLSFPGALQMVRSLLVERFGLVVHKDLQDGDVYDLTTVRSAGTLGPMLRVPTVDCASQREKVALGLAAPGDPQRPPCPFSNYPGRVVGTSITMSMLATALNLYTDPRIVRDRTGLTGSYDVELTWTPDRPLRPLPPGVPDEVVRAREAIDWNGPSLFTALQEQLGLKLVAARDKIDVLVIDRVERPTTN